MVSKSVGYPSKQKVRFSIGGLIIKGLKRKESSATGALLLDYFEEGGKRKKEGWAYKTKLP